MATAMAVASPRTRGHPFPKRGGESADVLAEAATTEGMATFFQDFRSAHGAAGDTPATSEVKCNQQLGI